jgi:hypothetical protein
MYPLGFPHLPSDDINILQAHGVARILDAMKCSVHDGLLSLPHSKPRTCSTVLREVERSFVSEPNSVKMKENASLVCNQQTQG